jgi:hypothetical protein
MKCVRKLPKVSGVSIAVSHNNVKDFAILWTDRQPRCMHELPPCAKPISWPTPTPTLASRRSPRPILNGCSRRQKSVRAVRPAAAEAGRVRRALYLPPHSEWLEAAAGRAGQGCVGPINLPHQHSRHHRLLSGRSFDLGQGNIDPKP